MARPAVPTEVKKARGTYRKPLIEECAGAFRRKNRAQTAARIGLISDEVFAAYCEAVDEFEAIVHVGDIHRVPDAAEIEYIATIENAISPYLPDDLQFKNAKLYTWINEARERHR